MTSPSKPHSARNDRDGGLVRARVDAGGSEFLLSEDVAALLGVSRSTVQEWLGRCRIPHRKMPFTRRCIVPRGDFEAWLDGCELETEQLAGGGRIVRPRG